MRAKEIEREINSECCYIAVVVRCSHGPNGSLFGAQKTATRKCKERDAILKIGHKSVSKRPKVKRRKK